MNNKIRNPRSTRGLQKGIILFIIRIQHINIKIIIIVCTEIALINRRSSIFQNHFIFSRSVRITSNNKNRRHVLDFHRNTK